MLTVYKASAGSGKTFQLVVEYLKLLFKNPYNYRHILAVTFTNKATAEMKSRILEQLYALASGKNTEYLSILQGDTYTEQAIRDKAKTVLVNILHDYNRFSINTIDSFTQRIIKSFNRELGISPNFSIELDSDMVLEEAVDRMLARIDQDKNLLDWLKEFNREKIEGRYSQRIEDDIKNLGKELFKEKFQLFFPENNSSIYSRKNLDELEKTLQKIKRAFELFLKEKGKAGADSIENAGFSVNDFLYKDKGVAAYFTSLANGDVKDPGARVLTAAEDDEKWCAKSHKKAEEIKALAQERLIPLLVEIIHKFTKDGTLYFSAIVVLKQLRMLGILADLKEEIKLLLHEKGMLQISDSNLLLSKIIDHSDSPFIYEKTGNYFKHFMLDEFQDTSTLQWKNFRPLVNNSLAEGNNNLIVGDVKQSIYRWRNSDWKILAEQINSDFSKSQMHHKVLEKNWRSDKNIIQFNNVVFERLKSIFETHLLLAFDDEERTYTNRFNSIYEGITQTAGKSSKFPQGLVSFNFIPQDDFTEQSTRLLVEQVKQLQDKGIRASDIAILIRNNNEGTAIIEQFLNAAQKEENKNYILSVLSNESLFLNASKGALFVMNTVEHLINQDDDITKVSLLHLWDSWLKPELNKRNKLVVSKNSQIELDFTATEKGMIDEGFAASFEKELHPHLLQLREKISLSSLDETITYICDQFKLFELENELPFLQALIDKAGELKTSLSNDLSNLLYWWNERGHKTSVSINENVNSIRLLTVHKSKGLEYKAVLIPNMNWRTSWSGNNTPTLWCKPNIEPFNQFPLLPVKAGGLIEKSCFKQDYREEKISYLIDTLNLVYVAFTRAKSVLLVNCPMPKENLRRPGKDLNHLLKSALESLSQDKPFTACWNKDQNNFTFGSFPETNRETISPESVKMMKYHFTDFRDKIKLRSSSEDFIIEGEQKESVKNTGKIIHEILSTIEIRDDIKKACLQALNKGLITEPELEEFQKNIEKSIDSLNIKSWFDGSYKVINERNLVSKERILRPDRIMISENETIVVDYKTGTKKSENYNWQVKRYAKTLKESGTKNVKGFIWYININTIEKVCEL